MQTLHETLMPVFEKVKCVPLSDLENESFKKQQQQILSLFGHIMTDILILIGSLRFIKEAKQHLNCLNEAIPMRPGEPHV